ncbi:MAG: hypothetical protein ACRCYU_23120 [Nocardioides sp.]
MTDSIDQAIAREVRESYRQLRRAEIVESSFRRHPEGHLLGRVLRTRMHQRRHRAAAVRLDRALLALEVDVGRAFPGHTPRDFIGICTTILRGPEEGP